MIADTLTDITKGRTKINHLILVLVGCVLFSGGCRLAQTEIRPLTPGGMPLIAAVMLMIGISLIIFALKKVFKRK